MSSTTENLGLTLPAGSEWADVAVLNENWKKIDAAVLRAIAAAAAYDAGKTYQQGDFCTQGGLLYRANQVIAQPEAWTAGHWTAISITDVIRGLTAADVGAAPDGFGLGTSAIYTGSPDYDLDNIDGSGWCVGVPVIEGFSFGFSLVSHIKWNANNAQQTAYLSPFTSGPASYNSVIRRFKINGNWEPWEWVNPTMKIGIEYRTTERWNGKPVYAKLIDFGSLPNISRKTISHNIQNVQSIVDIAATTSNGAIMNDMELAGSNFTANNSVIVCQSSVDQSSFTAKVLLKYTKTSD